jgi:hypothetical protein
MMSGPRSDHRGEKKVLEAATILAVGATAVAFVAGIGTYLYIRFTQNRRKLPKGDEPPPGATAHPHLHENRQAPL